jgi:hypothetical protein
MKQIGSVKRDHGLALYRGLGARVDRVPRGVLPQQPPGGDADRALGLASVYRGRVPTEVDGD